MIQITHWCRVTHICIGNLTIIGSDNSLSLGRRQAIIWTNVGILLIGPLGTRFCEISIGILTFSFKKMRLKVSSAKWWPFCLSLNVVSMQSNLAASARFQWHNQTIFHIKLAPMYDMFVISHTHTHAHTHTSDRFYFTSNLIFVHCAVFDTFKQSFVVVLQTYWDFWCWYQGMPRERGR